MLRISQRFWENKAKPAACHELTQEDFVKQEVRIDLEPKEIKRKPQGVGNRKKGGKGRDTPGRIRESRLEGEVGLEGRHRPFIWAVNQSDAEASPMRVPLLGNSLSAVQISESWHV